MKLYLDLDGVFADFDQAAAALHHPKIHRELPREEFWLPLEKVPNFFWHLSVIPGSLALYEATRHLEPVILTALPQPTGLLGTAPNDKRRWVRKHVDQTMQVICASSWREKAIFAHPDAILVDDTERNVLAFEKAGGTAILHTSAADTIARLKAMSIL